MGLPTVKGKSRIRVRQANKIMYRVAELIRLCNDCGVDWALENPSSSFVWDAKAVRSLLPTAFYFELDFCQYGERWRKRTGIATSVQDLAALATRCDSSSHQPLCSKTQKRHVVLSGVDPTTKTWRTSMACPYPKLMVRRAAALLADHFRV